MLDTPLSRLKYIGLFYIGLFVLSSAFAQSQSLLESEFNSMFAPLETVLGTNCSGAVNWQEGNPSALSDEQTALFRWAYVAAQSSDEDMLKSVVSDNTYYRDMYGFINSLKSLAMNKELINIVWCSISADSGDIRQTGGFAYLSLIDGEWKFHSR
jgi:hypothetical protein